MVNKNILVEKVGLEFQDITMQIMYEDLIKKGKSNEDARAEVIRRFNEYDGIK